MDMTEVNTKFVRSVESAVAILGRALVRTAIGMLLHVPFKFVLSFECAVILASRIGAF